MVEEYAALGAYLTARAEADQYRVTLTLEQIEAILRGTLPTAARSDPTWWEALTQIDGQYQATYLFMWDATLDPVRGAVTFHNQWGEQRRNDLADKYAIIAASPRQLYEASLATPPEDAARAGREFARIGEEFHDELARTIDEAVRRYHPHHKRPDIYTHDYGVGPAAQHLPMWLFQLNLDTTANAIEVATFLYLMARFTIQRYRQRLQERGLRPEAVSQLIFTKPILAAMCEGHIRERYHPRATIATAAHGIDDPYSYVSQHHPGGREVYIIDCRVGKKTYTFQIDSRATVQNLVLREGKVTAALPLPDWMAEGLAAKRDT